MRSNTERDLYRAKSDIDTAVRDLVATFSGFSITNMANPQSYKTDPQTPFALSSTTATQPALVSEELRNELRDMTSQRDRACAELHERDTRIQRLLAELQNMDDRCNNVEVIASDANVMRNALEEVARALILDSEGDVQVSMPQGSERMGMADRSPKRRPHTPNATAFAESTISAVQAALHKYQLHIHELQVKLHNTRDQLSTNRKSCEIAEANVALLEGKVHNLQGKLDEANADINQLVQEKESMQKSLETLRSDKNSLERNRVEINAMLESLTSDYEKLQKANAKLEKIVESLDAEKRTQQAEIDRLQREAATRETVLRSEEERNGRFRAELVTIREELNRVHLARDLLDQQKLEADSLISHMEKTRSDLEIDLERTLLERGDLQDTVEKLQSSLQSLQAEKNKLLDENKQLEEEKSSLSGQSSDQMGDLNSLRKELLAAEQLRLDLDSDKASLQQQINFLQGEKEKVELDLGQVTRERNELSCQLTAMSRKKDTLNEEIIRLQQRLEQAMETNGRLNRTLEDYVKDCEEKQVVIDGNEKDIQHLQEQLASLRSEKDGLEAVLFDTSNMLEDAHSKKAKLEKELQETLVVQENLKGQVSRLTRDLEISEKKMRDVKNSLTQQSGKKEAEYQQLLNNLARTSAETIKKVNEEKEQIRQTLEHKLNQTIAAMSNEKETLELSWREREKRLRAARDALALQHDEAMLRAENDKQQALLLAQHDLQAVMERLEELKRAFDIEQNNSERLKRDAHAKMEQDRQAANQLKEQLSGLKTRLDEAKASAEDDCARSENRIKELQLEKEASLREVQDTKTQLQLAEDKHDNLANQHNDTLRKLKEVENESESLRKELTDSRRQLTSCSAEREKYSQTCRDLREHVKRAEQDRRETARALDEAYHKLAGLEEVRTSLESERSRLQAIVKESEAMLDRTSGQVKATEAELKRERTLAEQMQNDGKEMQSRIQNETEERERVAAEGAAARRHAAELEALLGAARNDLARARQKVAQLEEGCRARDQELLVRLEDSRSKERRLEELKHNLEVCLADATQQIQELKARLGGAEGRCRALESQLGGAEASRRDAERRLSSVGWALRRVAGVQPDGSVQPAARTRRLTSPARRYSPHRGRDHSDDRGEVIDVDPDLVKKGIRTLMQEVAQVEREKEDYKAQVCVMRKQLKEVQDQAGRGEGKLGATIQSLRATQDEKAKLQACLAQKDAQLKAQVEAVQSKLTEVNSLRDKIVSLENTLSSSTEERGQYEDKCEKMRVVLQQYESELGEVREALAGAEARAARLDVRRTQLEGDLQRAITNIREKEAHVQKIQERCDGYTRTITSLEDRCTSLKGTIEQLTASLQKTASSESDLRSELSRLQRQLSEAKQNDQVTAEKLRQLQKSVSNCDNEKRILAEKLDAAKISWSEAKRLNAALEDQVHRLTNQLANVEIQRSGLESQLRLSAWDGVGKESSTDTETERELHALQREKLELKAKVDALQDTIRKLETEKRLKPTIEGYRSRSHDRQDKSVYLSSDIDSGDSSGFKDLSRVPVRDTDVGRRREGLSSTDLSLLEIENRELKMRIRRLEKDLADKESELAIARTRFLSETGVCSGAEEEARYRQAAHTAERLLQAREASHRQQMQRMETQLQQLRSQLSCELRRRQNYVARSGRAARDVQRLRTALGDSLRTVAQEPALDSYLLEHEARKLDNTLTHSLPPLSDYETIK